MSSQRKAYFGKQTLVPSGWVGKWDTKIWYKKYWERLKYHRQKVKKLTFRALAPPQSEKWNCMWLTWGGEKLCRSCLKEKITRSSSSQDEVATTLSNPKPKMHMANFSKFLGSSCYLSGKGLFTSVHFKLSHLRTHLFNSSSHQQQVQNWIPPSHFPNVKRLCTVDYEFCDKAEKIWQKVFQLCFQGW